MFRIALTRWVSRPLFALALCALLASSCYAVTLDVRVGFDGAAKAFAWTPITVEMNNTGDQDIDGVLSVVQPDNDKGYLAKCTARVVLPAHSKKLYHTYVRISDFGGELVVTLTRGRGIYGMRTVKVDPFSKDDRLVVSVGDRATRLNFLNNEQFPVTPRHNPQYGYSGPTDATIHVGSVSQRMLPDRPAAYEAVDVLVLAELTPSAVNQKALRALAMWVASGGTLVVPTGTNYKAFRNEFYDELLPVEVNGVADVAGLASLGTMANSPFPPGAVTVAKGVVKPGVGRVVLAEGRVPIVADRSYGAGRVVFLAFDHLGSPFASWNGQTEFWKSIVKRPAGQPLVTSTAAGIDDSIFSNNYGYGYQQHGNQSVLQQGLVGVVAQNPSVKAPSFNSVGLFLLAYVVMLVPVNYFALKRMRRLELAWATTPAIVLLFVFGAYAMGYTMKGGELRLCQATMIEASSGERFARLVTAGSLFSPARRSYDMEVDDPHSIGQVIPTEEDERLPVAFVDEKSRIDRVAMPMWSSRSFESVSGLDLGGALQANLTLSGNRLRGRVTNSTAFPLTHCKVTFGQNTVDLPDLPVGGSATVDVRYSSYAGGGAYNPSPGVGKLDDRLHTFALGASGASNGPVLVAKPVMKNTILGVTGEKATQESSIECAFRLRYRATGSFEIHDSMMRRMVIKQNGMNINSPWDASGPAAGSFAFSTYGKANCLLSYRMQVPPGGRVTTLILDMRSRSGGQSALSNLEVSVFKRSAGVWDIVTANPTATLPNAPDYISPDGEILVQLKQTGSASVSATLDVKAVGEAK